MATILVVEDDPDMMRIIGHALTRGGHRVLQAYGGQHALNKLESQRVDLIVTDLAMPDVSGVELIEAVRSNPLTFDLPIVAVTAFVWDLLANAAGQAGCDAFVGKPFEQKRLLSEVDRQLAA